MMSIVRYDECRYHAYRHDEYRRDEYRQDGYRHAEYRHDEYRHDECRYDECRYDAYRHDEYRRDEYRHDAYRHDEYRHDEYRDDKYRHDAYRHDEYRHTEYRHDAYRHDEYRHDAYRHDEYRHDGCRRDEYRRDEYRHRLRHVTLVLGGIRPDWVRRVRPEEWAAAIGDYHPLTRQAGQDGHLRSRRRVRAPSHNSRMPGIICVCMKYTFLARRQPFLFGPQVFFSCSRLWGTQGGRVYTTVQVRAPAGIRGACSGRSKSRGAGSIRGFAFRIAKANHDQ